MLDYIRKLIPERSPIRLWYHKISAIFSAIFWRFPSEKLKVIAVTGTSGKSTTVEIIHHILQNTGHKCGALSTIQFHIGDKVIDNKTLRTTLRPWEIHKMLRKMVSAKCEYVVIEVSSHAIDQHRLWGVNIDTAVLTNVYDNEHLDYHGTFVDYLKTKEKLFKQLNYNKRKPNVRKQMVLNRDSEHFENFADFNADKTWTFAKRNQADIRAEDPQFTAKNTTFDIRVPNNSAHIDVPMVGNHNLENILAALATGMSAEISMADMAKALEKLPGIPGRLESINLGQPFSVIVDFSYKPSALKAIFNSLEDLTEGRIIVIWGGAGGRSIENWQDSAKIIDEYADEFILTTDDPGMTDPKEIAKIIRETIEREEADDFFEIEDRYEAIRYAIYTAQPGDTVLIAGRGHEKIQTIGKKKIKFDDREIAREILQFAADHKLED